MKSLKRRIKFVCSVFLIGAALVTTSCSWLFSSSSDEDNQNEQGYLNIKVNDDSGYRTIKPQGYTKSNFINVVLKGKLVEADGEQKTLISVPITCTAMPSSPQAFRTPT